VGWDAVMTLAFQLRHRRPPPMRPRTVEEKMHEIGERSPADYAAFHRITDLVLKRLDAQGVKRPLVPVQRL